MSAPASSGQAIYEGRASIYEGRSLNRGPTRSAYGDLAERVVAVSIKCEGEMAGGTRALSVFGRQNSLDRNFVGSMGRKRGSEVGIRQRAVAAVSMADYLCGCCGVERSRNIPGYKASSLRT